MALEKEMIKPFISEQKQENVISYGLSSFGYDARVSNEFKIFTDVDSAIVDPKKSKSPRVCPRKIFLRWVRDTLFFLTVAWDVGDMLDVRKCDLDQIKKS